MIIAFSGIDGSGKSTQAANLKHLLEDQGFEVYRLHMTTWSMVNRVGRLMNQKVANDHPGAKSARPMMSQARFIQVPLRFLLNLFDVLRFQILTLYEVRLRGRVLVCDRYFLDLAVHATYHGLMNQSLERVYRSLTPKDNIVIILDLAPELALEREGEHHLDYYIEKRELYLERAELWQATVISVGALEETQKSIHRILHPVLDRCKPSENNALKVR